MAAGQSSPSWLVPAETSQITLSGQAPVPLTSDWGPGIGDPEATTAGDTAAGTWSVRPITPGLWFADPSEIGPYGTDPAPTAASSLYATVVTQAFDPAVTSAAGDLWLEAVTPSSGLSVFTVEPGQTVTIPLRIAPTAAAGTAMSGTL